MPRLPFLLPLGLALAAPVAWDHRPAGARPTSSGVEHVVQMTGNRFLPARLVIEAGDLVVFVNGSGGPHNVAFWPDSIPPRAAEVLARAMSDTIGPLIGPLVLGSEEPYRIAFAGAPAGVYRYYCLPHVSGGMVGEIEVRSEK